MILIFFKHRTKQGDKPFKAYQQVITERPLAALQIVLAIFAVEALGQFNQVCEFPETKHIKENRFLIFLEGLSHVLSSPYVFPNSPLLIPTITLPFLHI